MIHLNIFYKIWLIQIMFKLLLKEDCLMKILVLLLETKSGTWVIEKVSNVILKIIYFISFLTLKKVFTKDDYFNN